MKSILALYWMIFQAEEALCYAPLHTLPKSFCNSIVSRMVSTELRSTRQKLDIQSYNEAKYPTKRGTTTDIRKIVATGAGRHHLIAVRLRHILFATEELAQSTLHQLRSGTILFEDMAKQISACTETRAEGGEIGWVASDLSKNSVQEEDHLDPILPRHARETVIQITTKPGDVVSVHSERGFHLVQIVDVMVDVRKMAMRKLRSHKNFGNNKGKLSDIFGAGLEQRQTEVDLTYTIETMGCQMNKADSERIEGQLQSLGIRQFQSGDEQTREPDVVVFNTCSIRDHAEQKVYSYIGPYARRKRNGENVAIIVAGCVAQQEGERLLQRAPEVDLVMVSCGRLI